MGMIPAPEHCHITGLNTKSILSEIDIVEYEIEINGKKMLLRFPWDHANSNFVENNKQ